MPCSRSSSRAHPNPAPGTSSCQEQTARPPASGVGLQRREWDHPQCVCSSGHWRCWPGFVVVANHGFSSLRPTSVMMRVYAKSSEGTAARLKSTVTQTVAGLPQTLTIFRRSPQTGGSRSAQPPNLVGHAAWPECPVPALATLALENRGGSSGSPRGPNFKHQERGLTQKAKENYRGVTIWPLWRKAEAQGQASKKKAWKKGPRPARPPAALARVRAARIQTTRTPAGQAALSSN